MAALLLCLSAVGVSRPMTWASQPHADIGFLMCSVGQGSQEQGDETTPRGAGELLCTFTPTASRPEEIYSATFQSAGSDDEVSAGRPMIWIVKAPSRLEMSPGLLQQVYAADAAAAVRHAAPLVGQTNASIVLQDITDARRLGGDSRRDADMANTVILLALKLRSTRT